MITWNPWNPVAKKKILPNAESAIVKVLKLYSINCKKLNKEPSPTVTANLTWASIHLEFNKDIWVQVIEAPLDKRTVVFKRGTSNGLIGSIPIGGHIAPTSIFGLNDEWKNAQKKAKNRKASLTINSNIPSRNPDSTRSVCLPWNNASRLTSRHHWNIVNTTTINPTHHSSVLYLCI